jgi:peptidyl-prolyl cis-trans isomerase B (cyclophilin B)
VASKTNRQRKLERARTERRMAKRAEQARRKRQMQAGIAGVVALILLGLGTTWLLGGFGSKTENVALPSCSWTSKTVGPGVEDTGLPPTQVPNTGVNQLVLQTNLGEIRGVLDVSRAPCAAASLKYLAGKAFYNGTRCHHLDTEAFTLTCGSKSADGNSSPGYQFPTEGVPPQPLGTAAPQSAGASPAPSESAPALNYYAKASIVMANMDVNAVGAQFFIVYGDGSNLKPEYTQVGTITTGLDLVSQIAAGGAKDATGAAAPIGNPVKDLTFTKVTVEEGLAPNSSVSPATSESASASTQASPSVSTSS